MAPQEIVVYRNPLEYMFYNNGGVEALLFILFVYLPQALFFTWLFFKILPKMYRRYTNLLIATGFVIPILTCLLLVRSGIFGKFTNWILVSF